MLIMKQLINYLRPSFKLWACFFKLFFKDSLSVRSPLSIKVNEVLGRALFSGNYKKGRILASTFLLSKNSRAVSTNRMTYANRIWFVNLAEHDAQERARREERTVSFYGFALLKELELSDIKLDGKKAIRAIGKPTIRNPLHADIEFLSEGKDADLEIADKLLSLAMPDIQT